MLLTAQHLVVQGYYYTISCLVANLHYQLTLFYRPHSNHRQYLENWKEVMEDAYKAALQTGQCLDKLEQGEKVLLRNVTPRGGPRKLKLHWEKEVAEVSRYKNDVTYKIKFKSYSYKTRFLHRNMLMPVTHLLDTIDTVPTI